MKQYLLAALYNAPTTMQFNHDELMLMMLYNTGTQQGLGAGAAADAVLPDAG